MKKVVRSESAHIHEMETFIPMYTNKLTKQGRIESLSSLMFLVQTRDVIINGRACADGTKHRIYMNQKDATSPTFIQYSVMITADIKAHDIRGVATIMIIKVRLADLMATVEPKLYRDYIIIKNNEKHFYI